MIEFIKDALRFAGLLPGRSVSSFSKRRGYHVSVFTDLITKLKLENEEIDRERKAQIAKAEKLRKQIMDIEKIDTELTLIQNSNSATADKISNII